MTPDVLMAALGTGGLVALAAVAKDRPPPAGTGTPLERRRREALRRKSAVYRACGPQVDRLAGLLRRAGGRRLDRVAVDLAALGEEDWRPEEYVAAKTVGVLPVIGLLGLVGVLFADEAAGLAAAVGLALAAPVLVARGLRTRAAARVRRVRGRLPYTLDLMALVLEAGGGTLYDCLRLGADENPGHPLGEEFGRVVLGTDKGTPPTELLGEMARRLADPDVAEVNLAIATAETRGLPLKDSLRAVAGRLRTRQVQWLEKASEQAKVHITWPAMLVMLGCLLIVVAPPILEAVGANGW